MAVFTVPYLHFFFFFFVSSFLFTIKLILCQLQLAVNSYLHVVLAYVRETRLTPSAYC